MILVELIDQRQSLKESLVIRLLERKTRDTIAKETSISQGTVTGDNYKMERRNGEARYRKYKRICHFS